MSGEGAPLKSNVQTVPPFSIHVFSRFGLKDAYHFQIAARLAMDARRSHMKQQAGRLVAQKRPVYLSSLELRFLGPPAAFD